jgi:RNA binding exosome subunit
MKLLNNVEIGVFCKEGEKEEDILEGLKLLLPLNFEKEKIKLERRTATGFDEKKILVFNVKINKNKHITRFINNINDKLNQEQKELIKSQADSRLDQNLDFFIRFDKSKILKEKSLWIIDGGNCYHVRMNVAVFPKRREKALRLVKNKIFK